MITSRRVKGHSRLLKMVLFESLGMVSYSSSIATMAVSLAVCEIIIKEWLDLENWVRGCSRSLKMTPFDRPLYDFLFIGHSKHSSILHHFRVI